MSVAQKHELAREALARHDYDDAVRHIDDALQQNENDAIAMSLMSDLLEEQGEHMEAIGYAVLAINTDNASLSAKKKFLRLAGDMHFAHHNPNVESAILACLRTPDLEYGGANVLWGNALLVNPGFIALFQHVMRKRLLPWAKPFDGVTDFSPLLTEYFLLGISQIVVCFLPFERFMVNLRAFLLEQSGEKSPRLPAADLLKLTCAMARYAFHADFILEIGEKEAKQVETYKTRALDGTATAQDIAILGCYQPLYALTNAGAVEEKFAHGETAGMIAAHITEYKALQKRAAALTAATEIGKADNVASKVKEMYESYPYPRWRELEENKFTWREQDRAVLGLPGATALVAGCGTGRESCQLAASFPQADILAIDITAASLAYAIDKAEKYGLKNVAHIQADILELKKLGRSFDYIHCVGVLHHMEEPETGWQVLTDLLKPGGTMHIGLYGETPRRSIVEAREAIRKHGYPATPEGMRAFRKDSPLLLRPESLQTLLKAKDYYFLNMYSDLLFHVHEDRFTIPRIAAALKKLGLTFTGFKLPDAVMQLYRQMFPDDPQGLILLNWEVFEKSHPDTFIHSYKFWCRKP
ncbi:MAG TPA: methyltransferase domain-containing protein [Patescibacteria group bacterium]|nr:methyltransferase domain-containing protein [Patescibacteria group bacterium]